METCPENLKEALEWDYDYIVMQNAYFVSEIYTPYPEILSKMEKVSDNGKITVCKRAENKQQGIADFFGMNEDNVLFERHIDFESPSDDHWGSLQTTDRYAFSGRFSGVLTSDYEYSPGYKTNQLPDLQSGSHSLLFSSRFLRESEIKSHVVVSIEADGRNVFCHSFALQDRLKREGEWTQVVEWMRLPQIHSDDYEFVLYFWNKGKWELYYDDFGFCIY